MKILFFILFISFTIVNNYCQNSKIYDNGFKEYFWGNDKNQITNKLPPEFKFKDLTENVISPKDTLTTLYVIKTEGKDEFGRIAIEYLYKFKFLNNGLYEIELRVTSEQTDYFSLIRDLQDSFYEDLTKNYGKPTSKTSDESIVKKQWKTKTIEIELLQRTELIKGTSWIRCETLWFTLSQAKTIQKINDIRIESLNEKQKTEKMRNEKKIEELKGKL